ncbi:MAG: hypothetical protein ABIO82_00945, partial [Ginsengibacter sp.]
METNTDPKQTAGSAEEERDTKVWKIAQRRDSFKYNVLIYFIMSIFFWTLWYINLRQGVKVP